MGVSMQALMFRDRGVMELDDIERPSPNEREVVVDVTACGVCGSDIEGYLGKGGMRDRRVPPLLFGHEFAGTVAQGPPEWLGRRVAVNPLIGCGRCTACLAGRNHLCPQRSLIGFNRPGALAQAVTAPESQLVELPDDLPLWRGAVAEPLAVALHALELAGPLLGRDVIVLGGGAIGFLVAWAARRAGATVRVVDTSDSRRRQLGSLGLEPLSEARGQADVTVDTVGLEVTRRVALEHATPGGTAVFVGLHDDEGSFGFYPLLLQERRIQGSYAYPHTDYMRAVALVAEVPEGYAQRLPLEDGAGAFEAIARGQSSHLKVLLQPGGV